jgi:aspartyl-tRNA(Asn)/glutamyl-tRNA(Gln) amidotransferase subunit C
MNKPSLEVAAYAKLARLQISPEEAKCYGAQLQTILQYVDQLKEVDTSGVEEFAHASAGMNAWREDVVEGCSADVRKKMIESFPQKEGDLLRVQAVFEERNDV